MAPCPVCSTPAQTQPAALTQALDVLCPVCGNYRISDEAIERLRRQPLDRGRLAGALYDRVREAKDGKPAHVVLLTTTMDALISTVPKSIPARLDRLLLRIGDRLPDLASKLNVSYTEGASMAAATGQDEYIKLLQELGIRGYLADINDIRMTLKGWERWEELAATRPVGNQVFVAMSFSNELDDAYFQGIEPGIRGTGHQPLRLKELQHAGKIDDRIILEIKRSRFVVADFTLQRPSVYYEAGFAQGLGKTVIWTCHQDETKDLHFDTRQYAHIAWSSPQELQKRLSERIQALFA